jgi:predicted nuclease of predicted toxin-antitoxin system
MRLYFDDDSASTLLARLLRHAGHDVRLPAEIGASGENDAVHLTHAALENRICLSHNYDDFEDLHDLVVAVQGHHPGIIVVRKDNNAKRDLDEKGIVRAIGKLLAAGVDLVNHFYVLNHWR